MKVLYFRGVGFGFMNGIKEYVVIVDDPDEPIEDHLAPGFELVSVTELSEDLPNNLPLNTTLIPLV